MTNVPTRAPPSPGRISVESPRPTVPHTPKRRRRARWSRRIAQLACWVLAFVGLLPFAFSLVVRSAWARSWVARQTQELLRAQGITAAYVPSLRLAPLAIQVDDVRVFATDGGSPFLIAKRLLVRPKLFALLAGKLAVGEIDVEEPRLRAVVREGRLVNLKLPDMGSAGAGGPVHAPFETIAVTEGSLSLDVDGMEINARSLDLDASAEDDPVLGASFELLVQAGQTTVHRPRLRQTAAPASDDDALCLATARVRIEPGTILVRRFEAVGMADLDAAPGTTPSCGTGTEDKRLVELSLGHFTARLPKAEGDRPTFDGHIRLRLPIGLAERAANLPETDGWVALVADVHYAANALLPEVTGSVEAHDVQLGQFRLAKELQSTFTVRRNVIESPKTTVRIANGVLTLSDVAVEPLARGARLLRGRLDGSAIDFTALMRDLGVHPNAWVGWDVRELHVPSLTGTLAPLKLDGELTAKSGAFGVYDRPAEDRARGRLFGFSESQVAAHVSIRPEAIRFSEVRARLPHSTIDGASVSLGFNNDLNVVVPRMRADLQDMSPIGNVPIRGILEASARIGGKFDRPEPEGEVLGAVGLKIADVAFGDVLAGRVKVDTVKPKVELSAFRARRRSSAYEVPTARLTFGGTKGFVVDAVGASDALGVRDLLSMFGLDEDLRFDGIDATLSTRADVHVALDGPEDACGGGYLSIGAKAHLRNVLASGERFAQGDADIDLRWFDRERGVAGADLDVRSFVLQKLEPPRGRRAGAVGTILGSASVRRGGALAANLVIEGVPLSRVDAAGALSRDLEGSVSGVAQIGGNLDDFQPGAGFVTHAQVEVTSTRLRNVALPNSHLELRMTDVMAQQKHVVSRTKCGGPIGPAFDKEAYFADASEHGEFDVSGDLLGDSVHLRDVVVTRAKAPRVTGRVLFRGLDLGALARIALSERGQEDEPLARASSEISGQLWGELIVDQFLTGSPSLSRARLLLGPTVVSRGGQRLTLKPPREPIVLSGDSLTTPPLAVTLESPEGFRGGVVISGGATKLSSDPQLAFEARLDPVDLSLLQGVIPKVERARGSVEGSVRLTGRASSPTLTGELHGKADEIEVRGLPSVLSDVRLDVHANPNALSAAGQATVGGGTVAFDASAPIHGLDVGELESSLRLRGVRVAPVEGVAATFDADLELTYDRKSRVGVNAALPHLTGGVLIDSLAYTRPITFNLDLTSTRARRTVVNAYDPAQDAIVFDVAVRSRAPFVLKNNLVEVQLGIQSGALQVTGTNQRVGLRGALGTLPGGRFHFQANDFEVQSGAIRFDDPTRIAPTVDITATTEYRRYTEASAGGAGAGAGVGAGAGSGIGAASTGSTRGGSLWRITLHAYGDADNVRIEMTSEPALSQEDIVLLLLIGMTRAELDQLQAGGIGESVALNVLGAASGADRAVKQALPIIDDFRFGSAYSTVTGKTEPQLTVGKRLTPDVRASVTAGLSEDRELRSNIEWRLSNRLSVQGSYDNINDVSSSSLGNLGVDLRWRLEFE